MDVLIDPLNDGKTGVLAVQRLHLAYAGDNAQSLSPLRAVWAHGETMEEFSNAHGLSRGACAGYTHGMAAGAACFAMASDYAVSIGVAPHTSARLILQQYQPCAPAWKGLSASGNCHRQTLLILPAVLRGGI